MPANMVILSAPNTNIIRNKIELNIVQILS